MEESYNYLSTLPYYQARVTCKTENVESEVCYCPAGYSDYKCHSFDYTKCYVNVTSPALYKGCKDKADSDYYVYSIPGFDPCYFYDFSQTYTFKYLLQCRPMQMNDLVSPDGHPEGLGYGYVDVIQGPDQDNLP